MVVVDVALVEDVLAHGLQQCTGGGQRSCGVLVAALERLPPGEGDALGVHLLHQGRDVRVMRRAGGLQPLQARDKRLKLIVQKRAALFVLAELVLDEAPELG